MARRVDKPKSSKLLLGDGGMHVYVVQTIKKQTKKASRNIHFFVLFMDIDIPHLLVNEFGGLRLICTSRHEPAYKDGRPS